MAKDIYAKKGFKISNGCLVKYKGKDPVVEIPLTVSEIGKRAFYSKRKIITDITIHETVTKIDENAFEGCFSVECVCAPAKFIKYIPGCSFKSVVVSEGERIEDEAFAYCEDLESITLAEGIREIGKAAFDDCVLLSSVTLPDSVVKIDERAFKDCLRLGSIDIPDTVTEIGDSAFISCSDLLSINIPKGITRIGDSVFEGCAGFDNIIIPEGVTNIGKSAFEECEYLNSVEIPSSVCEIGERAFLNCERLTSVTIPKSVASIGKHAFFGCDALTEINCEVESKPEGWDDEWLENCETTVNWGYKDK